MNYVLSINLVSTYIGFLLLYIDLSDGIKWSSRPSNKTLRLAGSTVYITWHYECNDNKFVYSTISYNNEDKFYRSGSTKNYSLMENTDADFSVTGGSNVTIIIPRVDKDNSGWYCCKIICAGKKDKMNCTLLVIYALPRITYLTSNPYGKQGDSITLTCNASGLPAPHGKWIHKDTNTVIANSSVTSFNITGKGGRYCCQVSNDYGNATNCTSLEIIVIPHITYLSSSVSKKQGKRIITLECNAFGNPIPHGKWIHKDTNRTIAYKYVLSFKITGEASGGKYCCQASNDYGNATNCTSLDLTELPHITYLTSSISGKQGERITLECNASGHPAPHSKWIHKNTNIVIANSSVTSFIITGKASVGKYCCQVSNDYGNATNCTSLNVKEDKETFPPSGIALEIITVVIVSALVIVALILVFVLILRKRNKSKSVPNKDKQPQDDKRNQVEDESPYGEPVDAIRNTSQINTSASNADYATVEETGYKRTINHLPKAQYDEASTSKNVGSKGEPVYAKVKKKNKKEKPADIPLNPLYAEIPANLTKDMLPSFTTKQNPIISNMENSNEGKEDEVDSGSWFPWAFL